MNSEKIEDLVLENGIIRFTLNSNNNVILYYEDDIDINFAGKVFIPFYEKIDKYLKENHHSKVVLVIK